MNKRKVLIVDDQEVNRRMLSKIIESDYDVVCAENGQEALNILYKEYKSISAIILYLMMPVMNGYDFLESISHDVYLSNIPVIVTTVCDSESDEIKALNYGACDFVRKPYNSEVLKKRLNNAIKSTINHKSTNENDILTGINNKEAFHHYLNNMLINNSDKIHAVAVLDVEKFKVINDIYGSMVADSFLIGIAEELKKLTDKIGGICAHSYADQFLLAAPITCEDIERELIRIENIINDNAEGIKISIKAGIYIVDDINMSVISMCTRAKYALNSIKRHYGKKIAVYDDEIRNDILDRQKIVGDMKYALAEGQFKVYFQPKYDLMTEKIIGAEALVRWQHTELGLISPGKFIPIFEDNGFITELDVYVWEECCRFMHKRKQLGLSVVPVSINVSRVDIYNEDIVKILCNLVKKYDLEPELLHLEITESVYINDSGKINVVLNQVKEKGFIIEIDDFGSGYSSLSILSEIPMDIIKMDMKFFQSEKNTKVKQKIIYSVIKLAKWMNLFVIAEGVETKEQLDYLRKMKCHFGQGFYFARPMPAEEFEQILDCKGIVPEKENIVENCIICEQS